ncbi:MAG: DNA repair exonuclease [Hyphomicrobiaceae bacterium]|nr:MAG: DNA repair exonuclease [Hyphomicrobiaceae bacterium]
MNQPTKNQKTVKTPEEAVTFLHTADWHIRDIQYGRKFRGDDFRKSIMNVIDLAIDNKVNFIVNGGDTLHINRPSETMLDFLYEVHNKLKDAGIPMFTVTGNHDASHPSFLKFPDKNRTPGQGTGGIVCVDHEVITYKGIRIAGFPAIPFGPKPDEQGVRTLEEGGTTLLERIQHMEPVDIAIWHGALEEFVPFPMRDSGSMHDLDPGFAKAWLLGDIHLRERKRLNNGVLVSYPGTIEMCDRGEPAEKFVDYYRLQPGWRDEPFPEPVELELTTRPVVFLSVSDDAEADQALKKIRKTIAENPGHSPLIFARYAREQRVFVNRVNELIDPKDTVFRAASFSSTYRGIVGAAEISTLPTLSGIVDEVVAPGSPISELARKLVLKDVQTRHEIVTWVENVLSPA